MTLAAFVLACGCPQPTPRDAKTDCTALIDAARRAQACDPALKPLADAAGTDLDEQRCRAIVRKLLRAPNPADAKVHSVHQSPSLPSTTPLSDKELEKLRTLPRPATVSVRPDVSPEEPGILPTHVTIDGLGIDPDERGRLQATIAPGVRTLQIEHAGESTAYCVDLRPCEPLVVTAHGAKLAKHPDVRPGPC